MILYNPTVSGSLLVTGSLTTTGTLTAQTLVVQTITSSVDFVTGSSVNGSLSSNTHQFTGSVFITGSATTLLSVNNSVLFVSASGNVGIGNTSPGQKLAVTQITNDASSVGFFTSASTGTSYGPIILAGTNSSDAALRVYNQAGTLTYLHIRGDGNIGIGTTSPAGNRKLTVAGGVQITTGDNSGSSFNIIPGATGQAGADLNLSYYTGTDFGPLTFTLGGSERMRITSSGSVSIGTTNAVSALTVNRSSSGNAATFVAGTSNLVNEYSGITLSANVQGADIWYASEIRSTNTNSTPDVLNPRLGFFTQNIGTYLPAGRTEKMSILGNGNVGIGTTSPSYLLQTKDAGITVQNTYFGTGQVRVGGGSDHGANTVLSVAPGVVTFDRPGVGGGALTINSSGYVTLPSNPAFRAYYTTNGTWTLAGNDTFVFNATEYNIGSCYNTSNGRFTAPVAGIYQFNFYTILLGAYSNGEIWFQKNGADLTSGTHLHFTTTAAGVWSNVHYVTSAYLNSGDYVSFVNKAQTVNYHGDDWSSFSGYLVG